MFSSTLNSWPTVTDHRSFLTPGCSRSNPDQAWRSQSSGISINPKAAAQLRALAIETAIELAETQHQRKLVEIALRPGQPDFRVLVRHRFNDRCPLTGWGGEFCLASHITPFEDCTPAEAVNPTSGILLAAHLHQAFDRGLFAKRPTQEPPRDSKLSCTIVWSKQLRPQDRTLADTLAQQIMIDERAAPYLARRFTEFERAEANDWTIAEMMLEDPDPPEPPMTPEQLKRFSAGVGKLMGWDDKSNTK